MNRTDAESSATDAAPSGADAELRRLQQELLSYLVDGIAQGELSGGRASLSEPVLAAIRGAATDAMHAAGDEQAARLSRQADAMKEEIVATGGYDVGALAAALAGELRRPRPPSPRTRKIVIVAVAIAAVVALTAMIATALGYAPWQAKTGVATARQGVDPVTQVPSKVRRLCEAFKKIELPGPALPTVAPPADNTTAPANPEADMVELGQRELSDLCR